MFLRLSAEGEKQKRSKVGAEGDEGDRQRLLHRLLPARGRAAKKWEAGTRR
jgi:hypothetical protein